MDQKQGQITTPKNFWAEGRVMTAPEDTLTWWKELYFQVEVDTAERSQKEQRRDLALFIRFVDAEYGHDRREVWTPRLSRAFLNQLRTTRKETGGRSWSDRTINRIMAHLKTWAKWIHRMRKFPLGDPLAKMKLLPVGLGLEIERALTPAERRALLDQADNLLVTGGRSRDRHRFKQISPDERPRRKGSRPYRDRAIVYCLIETGMRRQAVTLIDVKNLDVKGKAITVVEKGGLEHRYKISMEGLSALTDYLVHERRKDQELWQSPALFLPTVTRPTAKGRLTVWTINQIWNTVAKKAGVLGKTPHSARHAMGKHIIEKTGNPAAVQRQLGHKNVAYSLQYTRISETKLEDVLNDRE